MSLSPISVFASICLCLFIFLLISLRPCFAFPVQEFCLKFRVRGLHSPSFSLGLVSLPPLSRLHVCLCLSFSLLFSLLFFSLFFPSSPIFHCHVLYVSLSHPTASFLSSFPTHITLLKLSSYSIIIPSPSPSVTPTTLAPTPPPPPKMAHMAGVINPQKQRQRETGGLQTRRKGSPTQAPADPGKKS